jgi:serine/threonine protein kinase
MTMDNGPQVDVRRVGNAWKVSIRGVIDERFTGAFAAELTGSAPAVIDVDGVNRISSFGVREWTHVMQTITGDTSVYLVRCRPVIVAQLNSVAHFAGLALVVSVYCPYACQQCGDGFEVLLDLRRDRAAVTARKAPPAQCPKCGGAGEIDDIEETYFSAIAAQPPFKLPAEVEAIIDGAPPDRSLRVQKSVENDITGLWLRGVVDGRARLKRYAADLEGDVVIFLGDAEPLGDEGVARLRDVLDAPTARFQLVEAPLAFVQALHAAGDLPRVSIVSLTVLAKCPRCGSDVRLPAAALPLSAPCRGCATTFEARLTDEDRAIIQALPSRTPPPVRIVDFITTHRTPRSGSAPRSPARAASVGDRIGRYEILRRIGAGGMAEILLGRHYGPQGFEKKVVIKRIHPHLASDAGFVEMFLQEARLAARLGHSNIIQIYDLGRDGGDYFIVMEYVAGTDMNGLLRVARRLNERIPAELCCRIIADVCGGLAAAHTHRRDDGTLAPILHRDVSPHNVMIGLDGRVKLADFGVAKAADSVTHTETGLLKGKLIYMPPEQLNGAPPEPRMDLYAAGLMLYYALTHYHPFHKSTDAESMRAILEGKAPSVAQVRPDIPPELVAIVERSFLVHADKRFQTAEEFQLVLEKFLASQQVPASNAALSKWLRSFLDKAREARVLLTKSGMKLGVSDPTAVMPERKKEPDSGNVHSESSGVNNYLDE